MGARVPPNTRSRGSGFKCQFCGKILPSEAGLLTHMRTLHSTALREQEKRLKSLKPSSKVIQKSILRNTDASKATKAFKIVKAPVKVMTKRMPLMKEKTKILANVSGESEEETEEEEVEEDKAELEKQIPIKIINIKNLVETKDNDPNDIEKKVFKKQMYFRCPECSKTFSVYFSALKHIQKNHMNNELSREKTSKGGALSPILVEHCPHCDIPYTGMHVCPHLQTDLTSYKCTGCNETFNTMKGFDIHLSGMHHDCLESMYFASYKGIQMVESLTPKVRKPCIGKQFIPSYKFDAWKIQMEVATKTRYCKMEKYGLKQIYRCTHTWKEDETNLTFFCPSTIVTQESTMGLILHFYKNHSHECAKYVSSDKYKTKSITNLLSQTETYPDLESVDENDLYVQFKKLMETIVVDAAKININTLQVLVNKALEMTVVITNYNDDDDFDPTSYKSTISPTVSYKDTSKDIKKAIENIRSSQRIKRKISSDVTTNKKAKVGEPKSPILQRNPRIFSLANVKDSDKILKELDNDSNKITKNGKNVKQTSKTEQENLKEVLPSPKAKANIAVGSPSFNDTYKDFIETIKKPDSKKPDSKKPESKKPDSKTPDLSKSDSKKPDSTKPELKKPELKKPGSKKPDTKKIKTKIGQFRPSILPKIKEILSPPSRRSSSGTAKVLEYEVKERKDDCNILILKI